MTRVSLLLLAAMLAVPGSLAAQLPYASPVSASIFSTTLADPEFMDGGGGQVVPSGYSNRSFTKIAVMGGVSTLGAGGAVATNLPYHLDLRAFGNFTDFTFNMTRSGFNIAVNLDLANTGAMVDYYPWKSFRVSAGYLVYNSNRVRGDATAGAGATIDLGDHTYFSDNANPLYGIGRLVMGGRGFVVTGGYGHIVSHTHKHFTFPVEAGVAFIDTPRVYFNAYGRACTAQGTNCQNVATFPQFQNDLQVQLSSWNAKASPYHIYPLIIGGVAYTFRIRP